MVQLPVPVLCLAARALHRAFLLPLILDRDLHARRCRGKGCSLHGDRCVQISLQMRRITDEVTQFVVYLTLARGIRRERCLEFDVTRLLPLPGGMHPLLGAFFRRAVIALGET